MRRKQIKTAGEKTKGKAYVSISALKCFFITSTSVLVTVISSDVYYNNI